MLQLHHHRRGARGGRRHLISQFAHPQVDINFKTHRKFAVFLVQMLSIQVKVMVRQTCGLHVLSEESVSPYKRVAKCGYTSEAASHKCDISMVSLFFGFLVRPMNRYVC